MTFSTGSAVSHDNFFTLLDAFLVSAGWNRDEFDATTNDRAAYNRGGCFVQIRWDNTNNFTLFQSTGYTGGMAPGSHPEDSGNGDTGAAPHDAERRVNLFGDFSTTNTYWFFDNGSAFYGVFEFAPGRVRHFWFGVLEKDGTWTGGAFCAGHIWAQDAASIDVPADIDHTVGLDSRNSASANAATMHVQGLPGQAGSSRWGVFTESATGTDQAGNARVRLEGFIREGYYPVDVLWIPFNPQNGAIGLCPLQVFYPRTATQIVYLGKCPDLALVNMKHFSLGEEVTVGSDTWVFFPNVRKAFNQDNQEESRNAGIAYLKVV